MLVKFFKNTSKESNVFEIGKFFYIKIIKTNCDPVIEIHFSDIVSPKLSINSAPLFKRHNKNEIVNMCSLVNAKYCITKFNLFD